MTKKIARIIFYIYQAVRSPLATCRFQPTCSAYALEAIENYGIVKGILLSIRRVVSCHPFSKRPFYDPV